MDSIIEVQRQTHEEIEHFERALYTILAKTQQTHEGKLQAEHKAAQILDRISSRVVTLSNSYEDQETRQNELDLLSAPPNSVDLSEFYKRLGKIQEHYAKYPETLATGFDLEIAAFLEEGQAPLSRRRARIQLRLLLRRLSDDSRLGRERREKLALPRAREEYEGPALESGLFLRRRSVSRCQRNTPRRRASERGRTRRGGCLNARCRR